MRPKSRLVWGSSSVKVHDGLLQLRQEGVPHRRGHQHVIRGKAGLAGVEEPSPGNAAGGNGNVGVRRHQAGIFAPQLQGDGRQGFGRLFHHQPTHPIAAREEHVVEAVGQQSPGRLRSPHGHGHHVIVQVLPKPFGQKLPRMWGMFRRLEHGGVARAQGGHQGRQQQQQRVVPGTNHQDAAQGRRHHPGPGRLHDQRHRHPFRPQPVAQLPLKQLELLANAGDLVIGLDRGFA